MPAEQHADAPPTRRGDLLDYVTLLLQWRKPLLYFVGGVTLIALVVSFLLPRWYRSSATLMPPKDSGTFGALGGLSTILKEVAPSVTGKLGAQPSTYNYLAILRSRRAAETIIRKFDLVHVYDIKNESIEETIKAFNENYSVEVTPEGTLIVEIMDKDSTRAAAMTNAMVETLNSISIELGTGEARTNREFLEKRVEESRTELRSAEERFREFQEQHGLVILPDDAKSTAASIGELYAKKVRTEVELALLKRSTGAENPAYAQLEMEKEELGKQLARFPNLGVQSFRLYRDMLIQQKILEFLIPLYEQARVEEHKDIPVMLVLDRAVPPERKARPQRLLIVSVAFFSALLLGIGAVLLIIRVRIFRSEHPGRYRELLDAARGSKGTT